MSIIREIEGNPCRDIIEGRTILMPIRTVKVQTFAVPICREPALPSLTDNTVERAKLDVWWDKYRRLIGTLEFTKRDLANFFVAQGWPVDDPLKGAKHKLDALYDSKAVDVVGRKGNGLLYKII